MNVVIISLIYMKHLLKILFLFPLFLSCTNTQEEPIPTPEEEQTAIGFAAQVENSRAVADMQAVVNDVKTNGFSVWGGYEDEGSTTAVFTGEEIILGGENSYTTDKYWTSNTYNFYAVYPIGKSADYNVTDNTFTINYNSNTQEDLLFAKVEDHEYLDNGVTVNFDFKHLLSHISIKLKTSETEGKMHVTGISLNGSNVTADYSPQSVTNEYSPTNGWSNWQRKSGADFNMSAAKEVKATSQEFGTGIFVIPQEITDEMKFIIRYTYTPNGTTQAITMAPLEIYIPKKIKLTIDNVEKEYTSWPAGMSLIYSGTMSLGKIQFSTPKVESWGVTQSSGTIIIK